MSEQQTMKLSNSLFPAVRSGDKTNTIRAGKRDVHLGPLRLVGAEDESEFVDVDVQRISYTLARHLTNQDAWGDNCDTPAELLSVLRRVYPDMTKDSAVTIIEFGLYAPKCHRYADASTADLPTVCTPSGVL